MLLKKGNLIASGASKLDIPIRNQQLYFKAQKVIDLVSAREEKNAWKLPRNQNCLQISRSCFVFNTKRLLNLDSRRRFAVAAETSAYDTITLTKTWLTADISDSEFILQNYQFYRRSERNANWKSKNGGAMIGLRNNTNFSPIDFKNLNDKLTSAFAGSLKTVKDEMLIILRLYNLPKKMQTPSHN